MAYLTPPPRIFPGGAPPGPPPGHGPPPPRTPSRSPPPTPPSDEVQEISSADSTDEDEEAREGEGNPDEDGYISRGQRQAFLTGYGSPWPPFCFHVAVSVNPVYPLYARIQMACYSLLAIRTCMTYQHHWTARKRQYQAHHQALPIIGTTEHYQALSTTNHYQATTTKHHHAQTARLKLAALQQCSLCSPCPPQRMPQVPLGAPRGAPLQLGVRRRRLGRHLRRRGLRLVAHGGAGRGGHALRRRLAGRMMRALTPPASSSSRARRWQRRWSSRWCGGGRRGVWKGFLIQKDHCSGLLPIK